MAKYENAELGVSFTLPDELTIRQQLEWRGRLIEEEGTSFIRHWEAIRPMIQDWECEEIPDLEKLDIDKATGKKAADIVFWASNEAAGHMLELDEVPKNT